MTYHFLIQISGFKNPEIWRRIEIPSSYTFFQFQKVLSITFEETFKVYYYQFSPPGTNAKPLISSFDPMFSDHKYDKTTLLSEIFKTPKQKFIYVPNSDKKRTHDILLEKIDSKTIPYACCISGEGAYPPETCSGVEDYEEIKLALSDKNNVQHDSIRDWLELDEGETWETKHPFECSKANEQLMLIDAEEKAFRNYTIVPHDTFDKIYGLTPALWRIIDKKRDEIYEDKNWKTIIGELQKLVTDNPTIPHFKNTLALAYRIQDKKELFYKTMLPLMLEYPNYVMARCTLANYYLEEEQLDHIPALLGEKYDLNTLYPYRNGDFTDVEILNYHISVIRYLIKKKDVKEAKEHFQYLEYLFPQARDLNLVRYSLIQTSIEQSMKEEVKRQMVEVIPEKILSNNKPPDFENPDIYWLFRQGNTINRDILNRIIKLPRESVIRDLEKTLIDSVARIDVHKANRDENSSFAPLHALSLLSVMQAEEALDTLFKIMRQDEDYYHFWYGLILTEEFWLFIYRMGQNRLERLKDFIFEPNRYTYVRTAVCMALEHIAYYQPERKDEILKWYQETLQYMLANQNDTNIFDRFVYQTLFNNLINFAGKEHLALVLPLYNDSLLDKQERLSVLDIKIRLSRPLNDSMIRTVPATINQFYDKWKKWFKNDNNPKLNQPNVIPPETKTGRNDPCPCGSGKKYKKCCGTNV